MQTYDIIMLVVLAATTIFGAIKGFAWQLASLGSIVASYFVAYAFRNDVAKMINADPPWNVFLAMLLLYFGSSFVIWLAFRLVSNSIDRVRLREFDRHLGAGFGLIKGILLCLLITMFAMSLLGRPQQQRIANSKSGLYISRALASASGLLPKEIEQVVGPYIQGVEQKLQDNQWPGGQMPLDFQNPSSPQSTGNNSFGGLFSSATSNAESSSNAAVESIINGVQDAWQNARTAPARQQPAQAPSGYPQNNFQVPPPAQTAPPAQQGGYAAPRFQPQGNSPAPQAPPDLIPNTNPYPPNQFAPRPNDPQTPIQYQ